MKFKRIYILRETDICTTIKIIFVTAMSTAYTKNVITVTKHHWHHQAVHVMYMEKYCIFLAPLFPH